MKKNILYCVLLFINNVYTMETNNSEPKFFSKENIPQLLARQIAFENYANSLLTSDPIFLEKNIIPQHITFHEPSNQCAIIGTNNAFAIFDVTTGKKLKSSFYHIYDIPKSYTKLKKCQFYNPLIKFNSTGRLIIKDGNTLKLEFSTIHSKDIPFEDIKIQKEKYKLEIHTVEYHPHLNDSPIKYTGARLSDINTGIDLAFFEIQNFVPELILNDEYVFLKNKEKGYLIDTQSIIELYSKNEHNKPFSVTIKDLLSKCSWYCLFGEDIQKTKFSPSGNHILKVTQDNNAELIVVNKNGLVEFSTINYKPVVNELKKISPLSTFSETGKFLCIVSLNPTKPPCIIQLR